MNLLDVRGVIRSIQHGISKGYSYCDQEMLDMHVEIEKDLLSEVNSVLAEKGLPLIKPLLLDDGVGEVKGKSPEGDRAILR